MRVARNRASWTSVAPVERGSGVSAKRRSAFAAMFLSLRRHDPDQVRRVTAPRHIELAASQPPAGAPLGRSDYPQSVALASRLRFDEGEEGSCDRVASAAGRTILEASWGGGRVRR